MKRTLLPLVTVLAISVSLAQAAQVADVAASKHNLSTDYTLNPAGDTTDRVCVFCHTPHGATADGGGGYVTPLWNRTLSAETYTLYNDTTTDALKGVSIQATLGQPGGSSKLCLSCHDGTIAIGKVNVFSGLTDTSGGPETMPAGSGTTTGFTRNLGISLQNDHPISFTYDDTLAGADGELYTPSGVAHIDNRVSGAATPLVPLENGQVQCTSCHDPHVIDNAAGVNNKFIREGLNRFQQTAGPSSDTSFASADDILCLSCHTKAGWKDSAHADEAVASETYTASATTLRDFPAGIAVWEAACMNCHDTHTVQGARKLLREGTDDTNTPKVGGNPAQEETCYQCHDLMGGVNNILSTNNNQVPDIKTDFSLTRHMPITTAEQQATSEQHAITDKDFTESPTQLGKTNLSNRHVECTDCHNPHRVKKNRLFNDATGSPDTAGTHDHNAAGGHTNIASGVLSGTTGVEPTYGSTTWGNTDAQISYTLKKGVAGASTAVASSYVTREYQVCLKCHSNYAWPNGSPPSTGPSLDANINGLGTYGKYTNQAMEFHVPAADVGETSAIHSSGHPVITATSRFTSTRGNMNATNFKTPWSTAVGSQTMYCTDCHGSETAMGTSEPTTPNPWGPHGSGKDFILKGNWDADATTAMSTAGDGSSANPVSLCFRCHDYDAYSNVNNNNATNVVNFTSGFSSSVSGTASAATGAQCQIDATVDNNNLHLGHRGILGRDLRCSWCHAAVPHGWKNKALLVNVQESTVCAGATPCNDPPYYVNAMLGGNTTPQVGINWKTSGNWDHQDCGGADMGAMAGGFTWMNNNCNPPP